MSIELVTAPDVPLPSLGFTDEQKRYLEGFAAGARAGGVAFTDLASPHVSLPEAPSLDELTKEERIKRELHPFDAMENLVLDARWNNAPETENAFRYKWNGLFWLNPVKDGYMCRLRIPGGIVKTYQLACYRGEAHVVVMPNVTTRLLEKFANDIACFSKT